MKKFYLLLFVVFFVIGYFVVQTPPANPQGSVVDLATSLQIIETNISNGNAYYGNSSELDVKTVFSQEDEYVYPGGRLGSIIITAKERYKHNSQTVYYYNKRWENMEPLTCKMMYFIIMPVKPEIPPFLMTNYSI